MDPAPPSDTLYSRLKNSISLFSGRVLGSLDRLARFFNISTEWVSRLGFIAAIGLGLAMTSVDEYIVAIIIWVISALVLLSKAIHWKGFAEQPRIRRLIKLLYVLGAIGFLAISIYWTQVKRGDKPWTNLRINKDKQVIVKIDQKPKETHKESPSQEKPEPPKQTTHQPEKTKQEQPGKKEEVPNDLKLIFKNSPLLTASRKKRILSDMNLFRNYLLKVGFNAPIEFPSIGVDKKGIQMYDSGKPVYASSIFIPEAMIDVPIYFDKIYAEYMAMSILKPNIQNDPWHILTIGRISIIYGDYFSASYFNVAPSLIGTSNWIDTLWEIRIKNGKDFTDKTLLFTLNSISDRRDRKITYEEFDNVLKNHFLHSVFILENDIHNVDTIKTINNILKSHGLE